MIQVSGLTKYYGEHAAIRNLNFEISKGEVIGFLGLNGAGKSTTLKVLSCVLLPTSGHVTVGGVDIVQHAHQVRRKIGYLPDTPPLYNEMTVREYLRFAAELRGVRGTDVAARVDEAQERMDLGDVRNELISSLSHGYRQRVGVAQALVHKPELLILDEPTSGLDPVQIVEMRALIRGLRGDHTVLISSHFLAEISQTCDRLLVISGGEIVKTGSEKELVASMGQGGSIEITVKSGGPGEKATGILKNLSGAVGVEVIEQDEDEIRIRMSAKEDIRAEAVRALVGGGVDVLRLERSSSRLESVFLRLAKDEGQPTSSSQSGTS